MSSGTTIAAAAVVAVAGASVTACGGQEPPSPPVTVTVTATPSPTSTAAVRGALPGDGEGSVRGRRHDVGTIVGTRGRGAHRVLLLDRWTVEGVSDQVLARDGVPVVPDFGDRFHNNRADKLYDVPLGRSVQVIINRCLPVKDPHLTPGTHSRAASLTEFLAQPDRAAKVAHLTYSRGRLVKLETSPRCPPRATLAAPADSRVPPTR